MPDRSAAAQVQTSFDLVRLREAVGAGSEEAEAFSEEVSRSLVGARIDTPQALNEHVMPILARHFPKTLGQARARPWQHQDLQARYPRLWQLRRALGVGPPPGLHRLDGHVLRYWRILVIYQREAREAKLAETAYRRGDQKGLFEVMRRLAPKQRKAKVQLRGDDGRHWRLSLSSLLTRPGNFDRVPLPFGVILGWCGSTRLESKVAAQMSYVPLPY
ncbi:unnamed protein product, partial [Symbiodinium sp. KB8]